MTQKPNNQSDIPPVHLLLKVRSEDGRTISDHAEMIKNHGRTFLGKMGAKIGEPFRDKLAAQISVGIPTFLFLTTRDGWNGPYVTFQCELRAVKAKLSEDELRIVPRYYSDQYSEVKAWLEIVTIGRMSRETMNQIYVVSSGREIMSVINTSATVFSVSMKSFRR